MQLPINGAILRLQVLDELSPHPKQLEDRLTIFQLGRYKHLYTMLIFQCPKRHIQSKSGRLKIAIDIYERREMADLNLLAEELHELEVRAQIAEARARIAEASLRTTKARAELKKLNP